ncbi:MAG: filamentous hemagglutinin N-terminal domain-containing protein [Sedimenticola sp.]
MAKVAINILSGHCRTYSIQGSTSTALGLGHCRRFVSESVLYLRLFYLIFALLLLCLPLHAFTEPAPNTLPAGGQIIHGQATTIQADNQLVIQQQSNKLISNWQSFSIGRDAAVTYQQPGGSSVALNRVTGMTPSKIYGRLSANGQVFLINPMGVTFGPGAQVDVGGLTASTLNISDSDFLQGNYRFFNTGQAAQILNQGELNALEGGYIALIAPRVINEGSISADGGTAAIAAGDLVTLDFDGNNLIRFTLDKGTVDALIENRSLIQADDGVVMMTAKAADELTRSAMNNSGLIEARGIVEQGGRIMLLADGGDTSISGTLDASSTTSSGGSVIVSGDRVTIESGAQLNADGATDGGEVLVGGSWQNSVPAVYQATRTVVAPGATLTASATDNGGGGTVVAWSDVSNPDSVTEVHGSLKAEGGPNGGDGGRIETSGHYLDVTGINLSAKAPNGSGGEWLLDPNNITINETGPTTAGATSLPDYLSNTDSSVIDRDDIEDQLDAGTSVTIQTGLGGSELGNIDIEADIVKNAGGDATLRLNAAGDVYMSGQNIISNSGALNVFFNVDIDDENGNASVYIVGGSTVVTNGGYFKALGDSAGDGYAVAGGGRSNGLKLNGEILTSGGDIEIKGAGYSTGYKGVLIANGSVIDAGGGDISITGLGYLEGVIFNGTTETITIRTSGTGTITVVGTSTDSDDGIELDNTTLRTESGAISLTGTAAGGTGDGIDIDASTIETTGSGSIVLSSTATGGTDDNDGMTLSNGVLIQTGSGAGGSGGITVTGTAVADGEGFDMDYTTDNQLIAGSGGITITGSNNAGTSDGVELSGLIRAIGGDIEVTGTGGGGGGDGIDIYDATIETVTSGSVTLTGTAMGGDDDGVETESSDTDIVKVFIHAAGSGDITIDGTGDGTGGAIELDDVEVQSNTGNILLRGQPVSGPAIDFSEDTVILASTGGGDITLIGDVLDLAGDGNGLSSSGMLTIKPFNDGTTIDLGGTGATLNLPAAYFDGASQLFTDGFSVIQIGDTTNTGGITVSTATLVEDSLKLVQGSGNIAINNTLTLSSGNSLTLNTQGSSSQSAAFSADNLVLLGSGGSHSLTYSANDVDGLAANTGSLNVLDSDGLSITSHDGITGITATDTIEVASQSGDISITQDITTSDTSAAAILINAGKGASAGTASGGDITLSGGPTISTGTGGRTTLMSGSIAGSTTTASLIGSGTGRFRYNSDEVATNYTASLGTGTYLVYREQPTVTLTANDDSKSYDGLVYSGGNGVTYSGFQNGDDESSLGGSISYGGSSQGAVNAGSYSITPGGRSDTYGYALSFVDGALTISPVQLSITANDDSKSYDAAAYSGGNGVIYSGFVGSEDESVLGSSLVYGGDSQGAVDVGSYTITPSGLTAGNYTISFVDGLLTITARDDVVFIDTPVMAPLPADAHVMEAPIVTTTAVVQDGDGMDFYYSGLNTGSEWFIEDEPTSITVVVLRPDAAPASDEIYQVSRLEGKIRLVLTGESEETFPDPENVLQQIFFEVPVEKGESLSFRLDFLETAILIQPLSGAGFEYLDGYRDLVIGNALLVLIEQFGSSIEELRIIYLDLQ